MWRTDKVDVERLISAYLENIFATSTPYGFSEALDGNDNVIIEDMNASLNEEPTSEEVRSTLFQMHPTKASGMDGFHALFFQNFWDVVGVVIVDLVKN